MGGLLDEITALLTGREQRAWGGSVEDLLYDSESVESTADLGDNRVVVTTHRVLAFTPGGDGERFRQVDRPNVVDVRLGHEGEEDLLHRGIRTGLYAVVMIGVGLALDFETLLPVSSIDPGEGTGQLGLGGMIGTMNRFLGLIGRIDDLLVTFGALALVLTAVTLGVYLLTRDRVLVIGVAGDGDDVLVPVPVSGVLDRGDDGPDVDPEGALTKLEAALFGDGPAPAVDADDVADDEPLDPPDAAGTGSVGADLTDGDLEGPEGRDTRFDADERFDPDERDGPDERGDSPFDGGA